MWWGFIRSDAPPPSVKQSVGATKRQAEAMTTHLLFVGDVNWGRQTQRRAESSGKSYDYITSGLSTADRSGYDAWIGNFECPITNRDVAYAEQVSILKFNCRPEYLPTLAKYFTASTLANNHMDNNGGQWGLDQTRQNLQQNGIQYFGTYNMSDTNDICEVISLPAKTTPGQQDVWLPVALCGYMYVVDATPTEAQLAVMHQYATVMPVIAMPHMGIEYRATAEAEKVSAYHRMIDNGADLVIGAHPHVIQNSESYQGRLIAYSVGNFLFDQQSVSAATNLALGVGVQLQIPAGKAVQAYQKLGSSCKAFKDDCLQRLAAMNTKRPPIGVAYTFSCYSITSGIPVAGTDAQCATAKQAATTDKLASLKAQW
ncbi:MAG: exported protein of unknown function [Candidatus Saccharibacteria bacterium]|nr:exported protein of unknown function [Candidatus Saccharibacteria bacterium]